MATRWLPSHENLLFSGIQWLFWFGAGILFPFWALWLSQKGYDSVQIGLVLGCGYAAGILGKPFWGAIVDHTHAYGAVVSTLLFAAGGAALLFLRVGSDILLVALASLLFFFIVQALPPIIDGWTMRFRSLRPLVDYGASRAMGSIGFTISAAVAGGIYDRFGLDTMFPIYAGTCCLGALVALAIGAHYKTLLGSASFHLLPKPTIAKVRSLLQPNFVAFMAILLVSFSAFRAMQIYLALLMESLGGGEREMGFAFSVAAISEVPVLLGSSWLLKRLRDRDLILASLFFLLLRIAVHLIATSPRLLIAVQALQGLSFGLFLPASIHLIERIMPPGIKTLGQSLLSLIAHGFGNIFGSTIGGFIIGQRDIVTLYRVASIAMLFMLLVYVALFHWPGLLTMDRLRTIPDDGRHDA